MLCSALCCVLLTSAQNGQPEFLKTFKPIERVHDFGKIYEKDGKRTYTFELVNEGDKAVVISQVNTSCGCMVADYSKKPIRPGAHAKIPVTIDPDHKEGVFIKSVTVLLNDGRQHVRLWVKAQIEPMEHPVQEAHPHHLGQGLWSSHDMLPFPHLGVGGVHSFTVQLANDTDKPMTIQLQRKPGNQVLKLPKELKLKPRERTTIRVSYHYYREHPRTGFVYLYPIVNGKKVRPIAVRFNGTETFQIQPDITPYRN